VFVVGAACAVTGDAAQDPARVVRLRFPAGVDLTGLSIRYFARGAFGGYGSDVSTSPDRREYILDTTHDGRPADRLDAIVYNPGFRIVLVTERDLAARPEVVVPIRLESLAW